MQPEGEHVITMRSDLDRVQRIENRARDTQPIRGIRLPLTIRLARRCKRWHPLAPGIRYGTRRRSPLSEYMSLHLSLELTTNCGPLSRIKWEIYFYKEVFRSFIDYYTTQLSANYLYSIGILETIQLCANYLYSIGIHETIQLWANYLY